MPEPELNLVHKPQYSISGPMVSDSQDNGGDFACERTLTELVILLIISTNMAFVLVSSNLSFNNTGSPLGKFGVPKSLSINASLGASFISGNVYCPPLNARSGIFYKTDFHSLVFQMFPISTMPYYIHILVMAPSVVECIQQMENTADLVSNSCIHITCHRSQQDTFYNLFKYVLLAQTPAQRLNHLAPSPLETKRLT